MFKSVLVFAKPFWKMLLAISLLIAILAGLNQVEPFITKYITDILVGGRNQQAWITIGKLLIFLLGIKLFQKIINEVSLFITNLFAINFESHLKQIGFNHLMSLSMDFFNDQATGKVMSKLDRGVSRIASIVSNFGIHFLPSVTTALIAFVIVVIQEWRVAIFTVAAFVPYVFINRWRFKKNQVLEKEEYRLYDDQYSHFYEVISSMQLIKAFRAERFERNKLVEFFKSFITLRKTMQLNNAKAIGGDFILEIFSWTMYAYMVFLTWSGDITLGTLILLVGLIQLIREPLWQINWIFWEIKRAQIGAKDFMKIMSIQPTIVDPDNPIIVDQINGEIEFKNVSFTYKNQAKHQFESDQQEESAIPTQSKLENLKVFDTVSFTIEANKTTAIIGPSGAGKTTIASLMMRFFDVEEGEILLDGINIKQLRQSDLRSHLGLVGQDTYLFAGTIEENLKYAKPLATQKEMWEACATAHADEFIKQLPNGLKTLIGERGIKLSGGQRQRLSLARTILKNPKIIILDEATSALDSLSEMYIQQALRKLLTNRTAVVIAHRLSTIQRADHIIVLKDQKVFEQGTHQQLMEKDGLYRSLYKIQSGDIEKLKEWDLVG